MTTKVRHKLVLILSLLEICLILALVIRLDINKHILGEQIVTEPIVKDKLVFTSQDLQYFYEPKPNTVDAGNEWAPFQAQYTINSDSLNERQEYSVDKPDDTYRIITLGDSYTYGLYVNTPDNWSEKLEDRLNESQICDKYTHYEVINLGMQGYDPEYELERFKVRGIKYHPDLVIWFIKDDDFEQVNEIMLPLEKQYAEEMQKSGEFDKLVKEGDNYPSWNKAARELNKLYTKQDFLDYNYDIISSFLEINQNDTLFLTFPTTEVDYQKSLQEFADQSASVSFTSDIPNIYLNPDLYFPNDRHPTAAGYQAITDSLFQYLEKNNLSCN